MEIFSKSYLPISFLPPSKLQEILGKVKKANSDYKPRLQYSHREITFILWYEISYIWDWQR